MDTFWEKVTSMLKSCVSCDSINCIQATLFYLFIKNFKRLIQIHMHFSVAKNKQPFPIESLYSSVAEHWSCKPGVESSILSGGSFLLFYNQSQKPYSITITYSIHNSELLYEGTNTLNPANIASEVIRNLLG